jgi:hypothetical protein
MVQGGLGRTVIVCLCALSMLLASGSAASGAMYFGATISGETYGQSGNAPWNSQAWNLFERHAGKKVAILNQSQSFASFNEYDANATYDRGAIPLVTMGLQGTTLEAIAKGGQDTAIKRWAQEAKAWGHPFLFAPWWEMNGAWYAWGRSPYFVAAWQRFHDLVVGQGATNVTWTWLVNSIWADPASDPTRYYPGASYVDWMALDSYNWGRNPAQPDRWITPERTITPTLKVLRGLAPGKPVAIVEDASTEYGGNKTDWVREMLTTYLPHHPEIKAYMWFNWNFKKGEKREDWPIESSTPAQQQFRKAIQSSLFVSAPVSLPWLTKVVPPGPRAGDAAEAKDISTAAETATGSDLAVAGNGTTTVVWSARGGSGAFTAFARQISPNGVRGPVRQLSASGQDALAPQVAVAPGGTATVTWVRFDGSNFVVQARRLLPGGTPEESTKVLSASGQDAAAPQVAVAAGGAATVVWKRFDGTHYLVQERRIAPDGTVEASAHALSEAGQDAVEPQVAVDGSGIATVVWSRFDGSDSIVQERRVGAGGSPAVTIANLSALGESAVQPRIAVTSGGVATIAWTRFDGLDWIVQARRLSPTGAYQGSIQSFSATGRGAAEPQVASAGDGTSTIVWSRFDGSSFVVQGRRMSPTGTLGATVNFSASGQDAADPQLGIGPGTRVTVIWSRFDGANWIVQRRDLAAATSLGATENLSSAGRRASEGVVGWGGDGTLATSWRRFNGAGDVIQAKTIPPVPAG